MYILILYSYSLGYSEWFYPASFLKQYIAFFFSSIPPTFLKPFKAESLLYVPAVLAISYSTSSHRMHLRLLYAFQNEYGWFSCSNVTMFNNWKLLFTTRYAINLYTLLVYFSFLTCWILVGKPEGKTPLAGVDIRTTLKLVHSCHCAS